MANYSSVWSGGVLGYTWSAGGGGCGGVLGYGMMCHSGGFFRRGLAPEPCFRV